MDYTQLFRSLREARGLSLEQLAQRAGVHRNTIVNIESGRPVKFKTIASLMRQLGFADSSAETKSMALLWLESVSGIPFSRATTEETARKAISTRRSPLRQAIAQLDEAVAHANLTPEQIQLLIFAARHPDIIAIVAQIRDLVASARSTRADPTLLRAAEDPGTYGER